MTPGTMIIVEIDGHPYLTMIDKDGVQRFPANSLLSYLVDQRIIDLNKLCIDFQEDKFSKGDYMKFYMEIGYSVDGFADLQVFRNLKIENPLWRN